MRTEIHATQHGDQNRHGLLRARWLSFDSFNTASMSSAMAVSTLHKSVRSHPPFSRRCARREQNRRRAATGPCRVLRSRTTALMPQELRISLPSTAFQNRRRCCLAVFAFHHSLHRSSLTASERLARQCLWSKSSSGADPRADPSVCAGLLVPPSRQRINRAILKYPYPWMPPASPASNPSTPCAASS